MYDVGEGRLNKILFKILFKIGLNANSLEACLMYRSSSY